MRLSGGGCFKPIPNLASSFYSTIDDYITSDSILFDASDAERDEQRKKKRVYIKCFVDGGEKLPSGANKYVPQSDAQ